MLGKSFGCSENVLRGALAAFYSKKKCLSISVLGILVLILFDVQLKQYFVISM